MNPLQKNQLRLAYKRDYDINDKNFVNIDEIKRANQILSKKVAERQSGRILAHMIRNRKQSFEPSTDEYVHYKDFEQRINGFLSEEEKNDQTTVDLVFQLLDHDKDGLLNVQDLMEFLKSVGSPIEQKQVIELLELMTPEGTSLTKKEFQLIFSHI